MVINWSMGGCELVEEKKSPVAVKHWSRLSGSNVQSLLLKVLKTQVDKALKNLTWIQCQPYFEQEVELETYRSAFQPVRLYDTRFLWNKIFLENIQSSL